MRLKVSEIVKASGGKLLSGDENAVITCFSSDSRDVKKGTMFVPMKGERVDSHKFIDDIFESGASASFTEEKDITAGGTLVFVESAVSALQKVAGYYRGLFDIPVIGVTGSAGKTSAKEMIALALSSKKKTMKTIGNQNSQIGVPLTLFQLKKDHECAVVEMGISMPGEMEKISNIVKPSFAVITNIGTSHIEYLKTRENILNEKLHIADYIKDDGALFVNGDDDILMHLRDKRNRYRVVTFGVSGECDVKATSIRQVENGTFFTCEIKGRDKEVFVPMVGIHNVRNALAAIAVCQYTDVEIECAVHAISKYKPPAMRQHVTKAGDITIIDDTYNASPDSVKGAVDILSSYGKGSRKIAVLGDMKELGEMSYTGHYEVGKYAKVKEIDTVIAVGEEARNICEGYGEENSYCFDSNEEALEFLKEYIVSDDKILIKGSRSMHMEDIVKGVSDWKKKGCK